MDRISTALLAQVSKNLPDPEEVPYATIFMPIFMNFDGRSVKKFEPKCPDQVSFNVIRASNGDVINSYWQFDGAVFVSDEMLHYIT